MAPDGLPPFDPRPYTPGNRVCAADAATLHCLRESAPKYTKDVANKTGVSGRTFSASFGYSSPRTGEHEIDAPAAALRAFEPLDPIDHRQLGAVAGGVLGRVGLNLVLAIAAPHDHPGLGRGRTAERCRRAAVRFHVLAAAVIHSGRIMISASGRRRTSGAIDEGRDRALPQAFCVLRRIRL